jgi:hypothetical protein
MGHPVTGARRGWGSWLPDRGESVVRRDDALLMRLDLISDE